MKVLIAAVLIAQLVGCGMVPKGYVRQSWASVVQEQAEAECYAYLQSAAGWGSSMYLCMRAKGYFEAR